MKFTIRQLIVTLVLTLFPVTYQAELNTKIELPDMGDSSGTVISPAEEKELGEAFFRSLHSQVTINQDAEIQEYIESIGHKLVANSDNPSLPFHFFVVMENDINAFAGPGGYIGVNSGLITLTEAESELASVMAHEIAHVTQRHLIPRRRSRWSAFSANNGRNTGGDIIGHTVARVGASCNHGDYGQQRTIPDRFYP